MANIYIPSSGPESWKSLLADPEKQWVTGRSAKALAHCWEAAEDFPPEISTALRRYSDFEHLSALLVFPEWKVPLPGGQRASQNDAWVLARCRTGLVSISIEGKVDEPFDRTLNDWLKEASIGKQERLTYLKSVLSLSDDLPGHIYYQLLHRAASAVIEAERFGAVAAVMLVHSISQTNTWFAEFAHFAELFGIEASIGNVGVAKARNELPLILGWVKGESTFLES